MIQVKRKRGFASIGLYAPKYGGNVGAVLRAAYVYGADLVVAEGPRCREVFSTPANTVRAERHLPIVCTGDLMSACPLGAIPVAVDLLPGATPLERFIHPQAAYYVFGPEDGTLPHEISSRCPAKVYVRTRLCMSLVATVNVLLYARALQCGFPRTIEEKAA